MVAFSNSVELEASTEQTNDLLQPVSVTEPVAHPVAECSSAEVLPADVAESAAGDPTAEVQSVRRDRSRKRRGQAANSAQEGKKQKVLQWLEAVQQHRCPNTPCAKCGRRGNWCINGSVSRNVFSYVSMYKKKLTISEPAAEAMAKIIDALD